MKYLSILFLILSMAMTSCGKNDEPAPWSPQLKITWIDSDETTQIFDFSPEGNIRVWQYIGSQSSDTIAAASFNYDTDGISVRIDAEEIHGEQKWHFEENLWLNPDNIAKSAEGVVALYHVEDNGLLMKKRYSVVFNYDEAKHLVSIQTEEKRIIEDGEDPYPLRSHVDFVWSNGNLQGYKSYENLAFPLEVIEYTYYEGVAVEFMPIVQHFLRHYYTPLQYQGYFGVQSKDLVKKVIVDNNYETDYSYDIYTISTKSVVENYYETSPSGKRTKYIIGWD